jgi:hypothetical protein
VLQPSYLPWIGYFDLMAQADAFVWYDDVQFDKHGWRNRNRIKGPRGPLWLTVPILHAGRAQQSINATEVDETKPWRRKHLLSIGQSYARAPFLRDVLPRLEEIVGASPQHLVDLAIATTDWLATEFAITTPRHRASELEAEGDRNGRLIELCRRFGATRYLSGDAARDYIDLERFDTAGIEVAWHGYEHPVYPQLHGDFIPYLSALDLLLNVGPASAAIFAPCHADASTAP